jgi:hypothetical protein
MVKWLPSVVATQHPLALPRLLHHPQSQLVLDLIAIHGCPLWVQPVSKRRLTDLVSLAPGANGFVDRFCRCFAVSAVCMAVFAGYRRLEAANESNNGRFQAAMACALIAAISGPIPMMFMTRLRL